MSLILKFTPALIFWIIWILVIFYVPYPESLTQSTLSQILAFFIPLFLASSFTFNLFFKNIFSSITISAGLILLLILKSLDALNLVTAGFTLLAVYLFFSYFRKNKKRLTSSIKIPKLTHMRKH